MTGMNFYLVGAVLLTLAALSCAWERPSYRGSSVPSKPSRGEKSSWSSWSRWSACSMTCGQGVKNRQRDCVGKVGHRVVTVSQAKCKGEAEEYVLCSERDCWGRSTNQRAEQCQKRNHEPVFGSKYNWLPHNVGIGDPCDLMCIARGTNLFYNFGPVADGTKCVNQTEGVCLKGTCLAVGCGDRIGSNAVPDKCGVCGGDNMNCVFYKNRFRSAYPESGGLNAYYEITKLPKDATYVRITENSPNYLVLADSRKSYLLNGNWKIDSPGDYDIDGVTMEYSREFDNDTITIEGPLKEEIYLMLLFREKNRGVFYEYNIAEDKFWRIFRYEQQLMDKRMQLSSSKSKYDENKTGRNKYDHKQGTYKPRQGKTFGYDQDGNRYRITTDRHTGRWPYQPTTARPRVDPSAGRYGIGYNNRDQYGGKSNQTPSRGGSSTSSPFNRPYNPSGSGENESRWPPNRRGSGSRWSNGRESLTDPTYGSQNPNPQNPHRGSSGHSQNGYNPYEYSGKKPGYNDHLHRPTDYTQPPFNKPSNGGSSSTDQSRQRYNSRDEGSNQSQHTTAGAFAWQIHRKKANGKDSTNERQTGPDSGNRYGHEATTPGRRPGNTDYDKRNGISGLGDPYDRNSGHTDDRFDRYNTGNRDRYNNEHTDRHNKPTDRQTDRYNNRHTDRHNNGQTDRYNNRDTDRHNNGQTDRYNNRDNSESNSNNRNPWVQPPRETDRDRNTNRGSPNNDLDDIFNQLQIEYNVDNGYGRYPHHGGSGPTNRHDRGRHTQTVAPPTRRPWWMPTTASPWAGWSQWREPTTARPRTRWPSVPDRRPDTNTPDNHYRRWRSTTTPAPTTTTIGTITSRPRTRRPYWRGTSTSRPNTRRTTPGYSVFNGFYNRKSSQNLCSPCQASGPNMKTYCTSAFVFRAKVLSKDEVSNNTRYAVKLIKTFKNVFLLQPKEYLWVKGTCTCPQLAPGHEFLLSGSLITRKHSRESRLTLTKEDFAWPYDNTCEARVKEMKLRERDYDMCDKYAAS